MSTVLGRYKLGVFVAYMVAYTFFYIFPNFLPLHPPRLLPLYPIDLAIPLIPWTFLIYTSDYVLIFLAVYFQPSITEFRLFTRQALLVLVICGGFFWLLPTTYPRPDYPETSNWLLSFVMNSVRTADTPNNCFPSMHVALTGISAWSIRAIRPRYFPFFVFWALAVFVSTMTTKQHYILDIIGGIAVLVIVLALSRAFIEPA